MAAALVVPENFHFVAFLDLVDDELVGGGHVLLFVVEARQKHRHVALQLLVLFTQTIIRLLLPLKFTRCNPLLIQTVATSIPPKVILNMLEVPARLNGDQPLI